MPNFVTRPQKVDARFFSGLMTLDEAKDLAEWCGGRFSYDKNPGQEMKTYYWSILVPKAFKGGPETGELHHSVWVTPGKYIARDEHDYYSIYDWRTFELRFQPINEEDSNDA